MAISIAISTTPIAGQSVQTARARDIHKELGVKKDFSDWVKVQINRADLVENADYVTVPLKGVGGKFDSVEYHMTIESGKHIAMMSATATAKGKEVRNYFIECEKKATKPLTAATPPVRDPRTAALIDALVRQDALEQEQARQATEMARISETVAVIEARTQGMVIGDVTDPRFGRVHSYHETILQAVLDSTAIPACH